VRSNTWLRATKAKGSAGEIDLRIRVFEFGNLGSIDAPVVVAVHLGRPEHEFGIGVRDGSANAATKRFNARSSASSQKVHFE